MRKRTQDRIENGVQILRHILRQETENGISVLLQQPVLVPVAAIGGWIGKVLGAIQFDNHA